MSTAPAPGGPDIAAWPPLDQVTAAHGPTLLDWAADTSPERPRVCLVRGARGSGKSRLLAWFLMGSPAHPRTVVHAAVLAEGLISDAAAWDVGRQLGYGPLSPARLLDRLLVDRRPLLLLVADLHRAGRGPADGPLARPAALVRDLLRPLLELPETRAVIEVGNADLFDDGTAGLPVETINLGGAALGPVGEPARIDLATQLPRTADGRPLWDRAPEDVRARALDQALLADDSGPAVRALITDPGFLLHGSPVSLAACLADDRIPAPPGLRETWRLAAPLLSDTELPAADRAALLHTAALGASPTLARYLLPLAEAHPLTGVWTRPGAPVTALAQLPGVDGQLLAADPLGDLAVLDPSTGRSAGPAPVPPASTARPQGIAARHERSLLLLTDAGALRPTGDDAGADFGRLATHHGRAALDAPDATPTALGQCPDGATTVVGDAQGAVHVWQLKDPQATPHSRALHPAPVSAVACLTFPDAGRTLVISAGMDGTVRLWETSADPLPTPIAQRRALVTALAAAHTPDGPVLAVAWNDATLDLWDLAGSRLRSAPLLLPAAALAFSPGPRLTIGGPDGAYALALDTARLWN